MVKLSNVVGGLLRDLAESHAVSDAYSVEILDAYARDDVLAQLPVPRLSIREAQLTLRFAVSDIQEDAVTGMSPDELRELWVSSVRDSMIPKALAEIGREDNQRVVRAFDKVVADAGPTAAIDPGTLLADGREDALIASTLRFLSRQVEAIAPSTRRSFENLDLKAALEAAVRSEIPELRAGAQKLEQARRAAQADVDVAVTSASLESLPDSQISELVITVSMDELQRGTPSGFNGKDG